MNKISLGVLGLLFGLYPNLGKAQTNVVSSFPVPLSTSLGGTGGINQLDYSSVSSGLTIKDTPGSITYYGGVSGKRWELLYGSSGSPITTGGSAMSLGYTFNLPITECGSNRANTGCASGLLITTRSIAGNEMVTSGLTSYAAGVSTVAGSDVQAINAVSDITGSGVGIAMGAYLQGRRYTDTAQTLGAEISAGNYTGTNCALGYTFNGQCDGIFLSARGDPGAQLSSGLHFGNDTFAIWREGITFNPGSVQDTTFLDQSSSTSSILVGGTHTTAIRTGTTAGNIGFGLASAPVARLQLGGNQSAAQWSNAGIGIVYDANTFTDTTSSGTVAQNHVHRLNIPTLAASSSTTYTEAVTLVIAPPAQGTNVTITAPAWSLKATGAALFSGGISQTGNISRVQWGANGIALAQAGATYTDTSSSGTVGTNNINLLGIPTLAASSSTTYTVASNLVVGAPVAGTNVTITDGYAARFTGRVQITGTINQFGSSTGTPAHIATGQNTAPALTSCGGSPTIVGTDTAGTVTMGTTATGCVITFNVAYVAAPHCVVTWIATPLASQSYVVSSSAITTTQTSTSNNVLEYQCFARATG